MGFIPDKGTNRCIAYSYLFDPLIREAVEKLNAAGFRTISSCQGKTCQADLNTGTHCEYAYVTFMNPEILSGWRIRRRARKLGLDIFNGGASVRPVVFSRNAVFSRNFDFPANLLKLFKL